MAAKKKSTGAKPFAGQTGRKPQGAVGTGGSRVVKNFPQTANSSKSVESYKMVKGQKQVRRSELKKKK